MKTAHGLFHRKKCCKLAKQSEKLKQSEKARKIKIERQKHKDRQSLLLFTRLPILGKTKTRLVPHIGEEGALQVHWAILKDFLAVWKKLERKEKSISLCVFYDLPKGIAGEQGETALNCLKSLFPKASFQRQEGKDIFDKMENAFRYSFSLGSSFSYLVGADIPFMEKEHFHRVFDLGRKGRQVLGASLDEGYYGIGLQRRIEPELLHACFSYQAVQENRTILAADFLRNGRSMLEGRAIRSVQKESPFSYTRKILEKSSIPLSLLEKKRDVDEGADLNAYRSMLPYDKGLRQSSFGEALTENAKISLIIPCYKEGKLLRRMERQLRPYKKDLEILFVDGGENHFSGEYRVIPSKKGRALQMNLGAEESSGDILFFLHCDSILPKGFMKEIREGIRHSLAGCLGIRFKNPSPLMSICSFISNHRVLDRRVMFGDQGIFVDRDCFFAMGKFPVLPLMEDYQFSLNLKKQGILPYLAKKRIITSDRRFQGNFLKKLSLMWKMNRLRAGIEKEKILNSWLRNIETFAKTPEILKRIAEPAYREALALGTEVREEYHFLARGEYNENFVFTHPDTGKNYVLRVNHGSQMQLERQISYEAHALKLLEKSGRTPKLYYCSEKSGEPGILVMDFLEGVALDYAKDLKLGAEILTDIHGLPYNREEDRGEDRLYFAKDPLVEMLSESARLQRVYELSPFMEDSVYSRLHALWKKGVEEKERGEKLLRQEEFCIINTELNSGNFLMNGEGKKNYLVDWEKPLYGHFAQDLGHFLSPTTTFWKTDYILSEKEIKGFLEHYQSCRGIALPALQEQTALFILYNCIRGLSWCAMAYTEYKKGRDLQNEDTFRKIKAYLQDPFLTEVEECCKKLF